jgi:ABC-2 type transport system ATP-binding protein
MPLGPGARPLRALPTAAADPIVRVDGVSRRYGTHPALDRVSLEVRSGETLGLVGANGAGKTTLMHLLAGIATPDSGRILLDDGARPTEARARRRIGIAFQELAIYPELKVDENVRFFARLHGLTGRALAEAANEAIERVGLSARCHTRAATLSGGMLRRLNLACAIVHAPELLLLDEPTAALDPSSRALLVEQLELFAHSGTTIVLSTHHLDEAERLCDRVAIIDQGRLVGLGTPAQLSATHGTGLVEVELDQHGDRRGRTLRLRWIGAEPFEDVARLLRSGERVRRLRVEASSLETAFFALTGRRLEES